MSLREQTFVSGSIDRLTDEAFFFIDNKGWSIMALDLHIRREDRALVIRIGETVQLPRHAGYGIISDQKNEGHAVVECTGDASKNPEDLFRDIAMEYIRHYFTQNHTGFNEAIQQPMYRAKSMDPTL